MAPQKIIKCAVYTRKSTEHNLDLEFNSLDCFTSHVPAPARTSY